MKEMMRHNHYVPEWYQRRFLPKGITKLHYLDLNPEIIITPKGQRVKIKEKCTQGPGKCFKLKDLYTTYIFGIPNDEIERFLFGEIDRRGSVAIKALVEENWDQIHEYYNAVFEYIDAQKLRTPKGLAWIMAVFRSLDQTELMFNMQEIRTMHCTMWVESIIEIIFADESDIKFILSDHPVTVYNKGCFPGSKFCSYPHEPPTSWIGTQTIFPLDLNHCLIITNLEYARVPDQNSSLLKPRQNARYFSTTFSRYDNIIRKRHFCPPEVATINYILKTRANRYIAACNYDWLYPEQRIRSTHWSKLAKLLLPPKDELYNFGGEIYVGGKNNELLWYQDEFGRTIKDRVDKQLREEKLHKMKEQFENALRKINNK